MSTTRSEHQEQHGDAAALALSFSGVTKAFGERTVLHGVDLDIAENEFVALLGKSGSGKTTILRIAAGLDDATAGAALVNPRRTVVFQEPRLVPSLRVSANVALGLAGDSVRARARDALREVRLDELSRSWPGILSGGEQQRVAIARAIVREPRLMLLDEPFAALDALTRLEMQNLLSTLREHHGFATLLVTHDVEEAVYLADRVIVLVDGVIDVDLDVRHLGTERSRTQPEFIAIVERLLGELGVDLTRY
jgi:sulfonate transport system ATP-binding protein